MKLLTRLIWGTARLGIVAIALVAVALGLARDRQATHAVNPEILPNLSASNATYSGSSILLVKGGQVSVGNSPCSPGDANPKTVCVRIWAKDVNNSTGASAFQIHFTYPENMITVSAAGTLPTWLSSTGRSAACPPPAFVPGDGQMGCATLSAAPPWGATGTGMMGTIAIESRDTLGPAVLNLSSATYLVDTVANPDTTPPQQIPSTVRSLNLYIAPCADLAGNDGRVTVSDILYVVHAYHTADPGADLDASGMVLVNDILISVGEFGAVCTP